MVGLGEPVLDAVLAADAVEDVAHPARRRPVAVCRQVGEGHAVVGQHGVDPVGEDASTTSRRKAAPLALVLASKKATWTNLDHPVDGEEHEELALGQA
jgi:hypothetical protein